MFEVFTSLLLRLTHTHTHKKKTTAVGIFLLFFFLFFLFYFVGRCNFVPDRWGNGSAEGDELGGRGPGLFFFSFSSFHRFRLAGNSGNNEKENIV